MTSQQQHEMNLMQYILQVPLSSASCSSAPTAHRSEERSAKKSEERRDGRGEQEVSETDTEASF